MTGRVRVGVIGVGSMGTNHVRVYSMLRAADLVGVADPSEAARERVRSVYGIPVYAGHDALLEQVDAVSVAAPTVHHVPIALECLRRGVHVLVEKPIAPDLASAAALVEEADRRRLILQVGHVERFNPAVQEALAAVAGERVLAISARRLSPPTPHAADDVVLDLMVHDLDIALRIGGTGVRALGAIGSTEHPPEIDLVMAHLVLANGILVQTVASKVTQQRIRELDITTERSFVTVNYRTRDVSVYRNASVTGSGGARERYQQEASITRPIVPTSEPLYLELEHFLDCVRGAPARMHPREAVAALELAIGIRDLARSSLLARV